MSQILHIRSRPVRSKATLYQDVTDRIHPRTRTGAGSLGSAWGGGEREPWPTKERHQRPALFGIHILILWDAVHHARLPARSNG